MRDVKEVRMVMNIIDANNMHYKELNQTIKDTLSATDSLEIVNVLGHRYMATAMDGDKKLSIRGVPGNDLGAFMHQGLVEVHGSCQDCVGNTMNGGTIVVHGHGGDTLGYAMRGGTIYIKNYVGYRVGIHMKEFGEMKPSIIIGKKAGNFLGEYMAGGLVVVLGIDLQPDEKVFGNFCGTGMHGGRILVRGNFDERDLGKEIAIRDLDDDDKKELLEHIDNYCEYFNNDKNKLDISDFVKLVPSSKRPYKNLYAY